MELRKGSSALANHSEWVSCVRRVQKTEYFSRNAKIQRNKAAKDTNLQSFQFSGGAKDQIQRTENEHNWSLFKHRENVLHFTKGWKSRQISQEANPGSGD